jgi:UDP-2,4-diacetamido-2,4,6-trideoxy-beta-L-altropyranose hydrolase
MATVPPMLFRADCSERMGTGHVMRCLGLAQAAQDEGHRVLYAMAECAAGVANRLRAENIEIVRLDCVLGSSEDSAAAAEAARACGADWIVLDGYHFHAGYQAAIKSAGLKLVALDDFGALDHYTADIIVNQDQIAGDSLYRCREPRTRLLLGSDYTFLRREFRQLQRPRARVPDLARRLLLTFGGSDPGRLTELALRELEAVEIVELEAVVLIGPGNPRWEELSSSVRARANIRLLRDPPDIVKWMAWCDAAVLAVGSTFWELAYCRAACLAVVVHEDQLPYVDVLLRRGACLSLGIGKRLEAGQLAKAVSALCRDPQRRAEISSNLAAMVDGLGAQRVLQAMRDGAS